MKGTLLAAGIIALLAGAVYLYVARRLPRPPGSKDASRAMAMFSLWWYALGVNIILVGVTYLLGAAGHLTFELQYVDSYLQRLLLAVSMVGLMHYLLYLLTGRDLLAPLAVFYGAYFVFLIYGMLLQQPDTLFVGAWRTDIMSPRGEVAWLKYASLGAILLPPTVCSLLYLRLFFRVPDATRKWRIALVSGAILFWWAIAVVAGQRAALDDTPLQAANRLLSLVAAFAVLAAYSPPRWAQRRWGVVRAQAA